MDVFNEIKAHLHLPEVVRFYGYEPNRGGFIICPFHGEKTPSLRVYTNHWHCYGCGMHGDTIGFVTELFGIQPLEAAKKLNTDFNLHLPLGRPPTAKESEEARRRADLNKTFMLFQQWRESMLFHLNESLFVSNDALKKPPEEWNEIEERAVRFMPLLEFWCDELESGNMERMVTVFRTREEVVRLCTKILSNSQQKSAAV